MDILRIPPEKFAGHMELIAAAGFTPVTLSTMADRLAASDADDRERLVVLTFDDGYENFYTHALPVLRRHGFLATVFVVSDLAGESYRWEDVEHFAGKPPRLMSWSQMREATRYGIEFHSHSCTHPRLSRLSPAAAEREIVESRTTIERELGKKVDFFCYPFGDASRSVRRQVAEAGYRAAFSVEVGLCDRGDDLHFLRRVKVEPIDSLLDVAVKLFTARGLRERLQRHSARDAWDAERA